MSAVGLEFAAPSRPSAPMPVSTTASTCERKAATADLKVMSTLGL
jgi:hypothetical protein